MFGSLKLGRVLGIDLSIHGSFWLLPALTLFGGLGSGTADGMALDLAVLFAAFGCVALHELGHAVAAGWFGVRTRDITLYPIGGVARLENVPERPWPEIVIALAGPAVNVGIAVVLAALMTVDGYRLGPTMTPHLSMAEFAARLLWANVGLVLFNLIPAFPMDGGRVFRALVQLVTDRVTATAVAAAVGGVIAVLLGLAGLFSPYASPMLVFVAATVFMLGRAELAAVRQRDDQRRGRREVRERGPEPWEEVPAARHADGWVFDPRNRMWTEWRDGFAVRRVAAG